MTLALTYPQAGLYMREREALDAIERDETQRLFHESQREVMAKSKLFLLLGVAFGAFANGVTVAGLVEQVDIPG